MADRRQPLTEKHIREILKEYGNYCNRIENGYPPQNALEPLKLYKDPSVVAALQAPFASRALIQSVPPVFVLVTQAMECIAECNGDKAQADMAAIRTYYVLARNQRQSADALALCIATLKIRLDRGHQCLLTYFNTTEAGVELRQLLYLDRKPA